ncbi:hypothetical protein EVAR_26040_1 [Eumeta japonica]|uniref:Uncharacterized protein n=1 Tax=Eumeta variegata TaxID=151549 RepID=A0A4C1VRZ7_EUMVA|nr:hypothetical protein EVAR_26040_1 [Eumeta japonica]
MFEKDKVREELRHNISLNKTRESMLLDDTVIEDDLALLRVENDLLKELNSELKEKNGMLRELAKDRNNCNKTNVASYADIAKCDKNNTRKIIPNIKAKDKKNKDTVNQVKCQLLGDIAVAIKKLENKQTNLVMLPSSVKTKKTSKELRPC